MEMSDKKHSIKIAKVNFQKLGKSHKNQSTMTDYYKSMKGKCLRCSSSKHRQSDCDRQDFAKNAGRTDIPLLYASLAWLDASKNKEAAQVETRKPQQELPKWRETKHTANLCTMPAQSEDEESSNDEEITACKMVKHKLFFIQNKQTEKGDRHRANACLLYTSDAADE